MRIYTNCLELMSEAMRDVWEMGTLVKPKSYQNKNIEGDPSFETKEVICYQYCLTSLKEEDYLYLSDKRSKEWVEQELIERVTPPNLEGGPNYYSNINPGSAWLLREDVWRQFLVFGKFDYSYNERLNYNWRRNPGINIPYEYSYALGKVISELINNPDTRQAVLPIYHPSDIKHIGGEKRVPCSMYYDLLIRKNASGNMQLNICYHQRSSDIVTHFGNDVALAYKLMEFIAEKVGVKPGYLYHTIDSLHAYRKDWDILKTCVNDLLK